MKDIFEFYVTETNKKLEKMDERFDKVDKKLDSLISFKWKIVGGASITFLFLQIFTKIIG